MSRYHYIYNIGELLEVSFVDTPWISILVISLFIVCVRTHRIYRILAYIEQVFPPISPIYRGITVVWNKRERVATLVEVSVPSDSGLNRAEREKVTKYQGLMYDMKRNWNLREISIIPVIIGATGLMKKNFKKYLASVPGNPRASEIQIIALKGTARILKRALGWNL